MCTKAKIIKWYFPSFQNKMFEGSREREHCYSPFSVPVQLSSAFLAWHWQRWTEGVQKHKPLEHTCCTKGQCDMKLFSHSQVFCAQSNNNNNKKWMCFALGCSKTPQTFPKAPCSILTEPSLFVSLFSCWSPLPRHPDRAADCTSPHNLSCSWAPPRPSPFPLASSPSPSAGNGIPQGLQNPEAAKEAEVTPNPAPLGAGEAEEEQSLSFRSYKINQGLGNQPEEPFIVTPGT